MRNRHASTHNLTSVKTAFPHISRQFFTTCKKSSQLTQSVTLCCAFCRCSVASPQCPCFYWWFVLIRFKNYSLKVRHCTCWIVTIEHRLSFLRQVIPWATFECLHSHLFDVEVKQKPVPVVTKFNTESWCKIVIQFCCHGVFDMIFTPVALPEQVSWMTTFNALSTDLNEVVPQQLSC